MASLGDGGGRQSDTGKAEAFPHHPRIERSCPNSRQRLPYAGPGRVSDAAAAIPYDARPSLSAAASAAVTRNVELLSGL